jgi:hypothetical protein
MDETPAEAAADYLREALDSAQMASLMLSQPEKRWSWYDMASNYLWDVIAHIELARDALLGQLPDDPDDEHASPS